MQQRIPWRACFLGFGFSGLAGLPSLMSPSVKVRAQVTASECQGSFREGLAGNSERILVLVQYYVELPHSPGTSVSPLNPKLLCA